MENNKRNQKREGIDVPFGPPPEEYTYCCSDCKYKMEVNEAIIDLEVAKAIDEGKDEDFMPILGCPNCNNESMVYEEDKSPPAGR